MARDISSPEKTDISPAARSKTYILQRAIIELMLQKHQAAFTTQLVTTALSRALYFGLLLFITLPDQLSLTQAVIAGLIACSLFIVSWITIRRSDREMAIIGKALSQRAAEDWEDLYVETQQIPYMRGIWRFYVRLEPAFWCYLCLGILVVTRV